MFSTRPILSYNRTEYCPVNAELTIIRSDGIVAIVETCAGQRFPCLVEMLSEELTVVVVEEKIEVVVTDQLSLF
jgi:hypothetical protein